MTTPSPNPVESLRALPELLPCPFCGGTASAPYAVDVPAGWWELAITCERCNSAMTAVESTEADLIAAWNRRSASAPDAELIAVIPPAKAMYGDDLQSLKKAYEYFMERMGECGPIETPEDYSVEGYYCRMGCAVERAIKTLEVARAILAKHSTAAEEGHG